MSLNMKAPQPAGSSESRCTASPISSQHAHAALVVDAFSKCRALVELGNLLTKGAEMDRGHSAIYTRQRYCLPRAAAAAIIDADRFRLRSWQRCAHP